MHSERKIEKDRERKRRGTHSGIQITREENNIFLETARMHNKRDNEI